MPMPIRAQRILTPSQLGLLLQSARKHRKLSQQELARRLGLSQNRLSELERNAGVLSVDQLLAICGQLGLQLTVQRRAEPTSVDAVTPSTDW